MQRHSRTFLCGVCGGHAGLRPGRGVRDAGFTLDAVIYCTRAEHAGALALDMSVSPPAYKHRRYGPCPCGYEHGTAIGGYSPIRVLPKPKPSRTEAAPLTDRDRVYRAALGYLTLRPEAAADLIARGLSMEVIERAGYRSIPRKGRELDEFKAAMVAQFGEAALRRIPGFTDKNGRFTFWSALHDRDGYIVPYTDELGMITGIQLRTLTGDGVKYKTALGTSLAAVYHVSGYSGPDGDLYVTEGGTKARVAHHLTGWPVMGLAGQSLMAEHIAVIQRLRPARAIIALDQDDEGNGRANTDRAREHWARDLADVGIPVFEAVWDGANRGGPKGLDDLVHAGGRPRIRALHPVPSVLGTRRAPYAIAGMGPIEAGRSLPEVRGDVRAAIRNVIAHARRHKGKAVLIASSPGAGKTTATAEALSETRGAVAAIVVGNRKLAQELADAHGYRLFQGRNLETCHEDRLPVVQALGDKGFPIGTIACGTVEEPRCPFRRGCAYWQQGSTGTRVGTAEQIFNPRFLEGASVLVSDDGDLDRALIQRVSFSGETLEKAIPVLGTGRKPLVQLIDILRHAIVSAPRNDSGTGGPALMGARVWDHMATVARQQGRDLGALITSIPDGTSIPQPAGDDQQIVRLADVEIAPPASLLLLVRTLKEELPAYLAGDEFNSYIRLHPGGIDLWRPREHARRRKQDAGESEHYVRDMAILVLDGTPNQRLVDLLTVYHERLPDVRGVIALPQNVTVTQHAEAGNGHTALKDDRKRQALIDQIAASRQQHPVDGPTREAAIGFKAHRDELVGIGFAEEQVLTFGAARGTNALAGVERLHLAGRPMPPPPELVFLAQVLHHDESPISPALTVARREYGGQKYAIDVVDFVDPRPAALLRGRRDDEIVQVIHRARLLTLDPQMSLEGVDGANIGTAAGARRHVHLIMHSSYPIAGLRVDHLHLPAARPDVNAERAVAAAERVAATMAVLEERGEKVTAHAIRRETGGHFYDISKHLASVGTKVTTLKEDLLMGGNFFPHTKPPDPDPPISTDSEPLVRDDGRGGAPESAATRPTQGRYCESNTLHRICPHWESSPGYWACSWCDPPPA